MGFMEEYTFLLVALHNVLYVTSSGDRDTHYAVGAWLHSSAHGTLLGGYAL